MVGVGVSACLFGVSISVRGVGVTSTESIFSDCIGAEVVGVDVVGEALIFCSVLDVHAQRKNIMSKIE